MVKKIIYFADLTHTSQTIASEFMPYNVGCIASYFLHNSKYADIFDVELFKYPEELIDAIHDRKPYAIACSNFVWNSDLSSKIVRLAKKTYPDIVNIFGGIDFPDDNIDQERWLKKRPWIDFYVRLEGEIAFVNLIDSLIENKNDILKCKQLCLNSVSSIDDCGNFYGSNIENRIIDFDDIPSPYTDGLMDKFFNTTLWPLVETNRGCPFKCAFCSEGSSYYNKVAKKHNNKITSELEYIAKNHNKQKMMFVADSNFLMFKENIDVCNTLAELKKKYNWPTFIGSSTGKNRQELVLKGAEILDGDIALSASVQHLDEEVLKNIKRNNISIDDIIKIGTDGAKHGVPTYSEVIASLPGDTLEKYFLCLKDLVLTGIDIIRTHTLLMIKGSELYSVENRKKYGFRTKFRATAKSFGAYKFDDANTILSVEEEEIVTETSTLSFDDYIECRRLQISMQIFYNDDLFHELHNVLKMMDVSIWDWMMECHNNPNTYNKGTKTLIDSYMSDVKVELFESSEMLQEDFKRNYELYINGEKGSNVTFKHKALLFKEFIADILDYGFNQAEHIMRRVDNKRYNEYKDYLDEMKMVNFLRKTDIFNTSAIHKTRLWFNPSNYGEHNSELNNIKKEKAPFLVKISHDDNQIAMLDHYFMDHSQDNIIELAWLLNRLPARSIYRKIEIIQ